MPKCKPMSTHFVSSRWFFSFACSSARPSQRQMRWGTARSQGWSLCDIKLYKLAGDHWLAFPWVGGWVIPFPAKLRSSASIPCSCLQTRPIPFRVPLATWRRWLLICFLYRNFSNYNIKKWQSKSSISGLNPRNCSRWRWKGSQW